MNDIIKLIQHTRLQKGYNFYDIEQATGIPTKRMHSFEKGLTQLSVEELDKVFTFLGLQKVKDIPRRSNRNKSKWLLKSFITMAVIAVLVLIKLLLTSPAEPGQSAPTSGDPQVSEPDSSGGTGVTVEPPAPPTHVDNGTTEPTTSLPTNDEEERMVLRFWGNMPYHVAKAPSLPTTDGIPPTEIFTIEGLQKQDAIPQWLVDRNKGSTILNLATRFVWSEAQQDEFIATKERDRLHKLGYTTIGLDYREEVDKPYILDTHVGKIGFLPFTRHVLDAEHLAERNEIGVMRATDMRTIAPMITSAKEDVDFLIVLVGWGERESDSPDASQKRIARDMVAAGADFVIGNHAIYGQEVEWIDDAPVFYSLGQAVSAEPVVAYTFAVDVEIKKDASFAARLHIGKMVHGELTFALSADERKRVAEALLTPQALEMVQVD